MVNESISAHYSQDHAELELVRTLLESEHSAYPWNLTEPATEAYFTALENLATPSWDPADLSRASQKLMEFCSQQWSRSSLQKFAHRMPQALLDTIAQRAQQLLSTPLSLADQLVQCVADSLSNWSEEDLQILARPLAYAMRGDETERLDSILATVRPVEWAELSEIEQARLSLVVARYALNQAQSSIQATEEI